MPTNPTPVLAWHFVGATLRDGRAIPPDGEVLIHKGPLVICESGMHASERLIDALQYAPGNTLCRVRMSGKAVRQDDKLATTERTILWRIDATDVLRAFARRCALDVAHLWEMPPVVRQYLETGDESLRAAVWAAAWDARAAARTVTWDAARTAARAAEWDAAWAARDARAAVMAAQNTILTAMVYAAAARTPEQEDAR